MNANAFKIHNLPKDDFVLAKSELNSDDDLLRRYSKDLGKVSDDVKHFVEKSLRVAKALLRDWLLKNDDGSDVRDGRNEREEKEPSTGEQ
ncbi:unnamed protein product [Medioppia subpectinata]|uniref:Uncharacterized protein n=1 Tax=Medioppia subpectinata TaxID=1979941 RepID=A0A7R9Q9Q9_9ACAR|nr:unnamed protein product [Medioppia subpectinata]CAG2117194.1 unnamed protein product [Medioppia subpectinata]